MKPNLKSLLAMAMMASVLILSSCGKDDDPAKSKTVLLTQHTWKFSAVTSDFPGFDLFKEEFATDYESDEFKFNEDKTYTYTNTADASANMSGKWEFSSDETKLILDKGTDDEETYTVVKLDEGTLETSITDPFFSITFNLIYVKK